MEVAACLVEQGTAMAAGTRAGLVATLALADGRLVKSLDIHGTCKGDTQRGGVQPCFTTACWPGLAATVGGALYVTSENGLHCGNTLLSAEAFLSAPVVVCGGTLVVAVSASGVACCFEGLALQWRVCLSSKRPAPSAFLAAPAVQSASRVWFTAVDRTHLVDLSTGQVLADCALPMQTFCAPLCLHDERALFAGLDRLCLVHADGALEPVLEGLAFRISTSPALVSRTPTQAVLGTECGRLLVVDVERRSVLRVLAVCPSFPIFSTPALLPDARAVVVGTRANTIVRVALP